MVILCCVAGTVFQSAMSTIRDITHVASGDCILVVYSRVVAPRPTTAVTLLAATGKSSTELTAN